MSESVESVTQSLHLLFDRLIKCPMLKKGNEWKGQWEGWDESTWVGHRTGVYVLWKSDTDPGTGTQPVYIGEGITGTRVHDSFNSRKEWNYAQVLYDEKFDDETEGPKWRLLLERFAILVLNPQKNIR